MDAQRILEIEKTFREMGLNEKSWGKQTKIDPDKSFFIDPTVLKHVPYRIDNVTTPLKEDPNANLA